MIVESKEAIATSANKIVYAMYDVILKEICDHPYDGAELIYLLMHVTSQFVAKMKSLTENYSGIFGLPVPFDEWLETMVDEYFLQLQGKPAPIVS